MLDGALGVGKTCFAQGVARGLGVPPGVPVTSPSYSLMNIHEGRIPLYHFDLYRLNRIDDLGDLGYDEYAEGDGLTLVEWAGRLRAGLDANLVVEISRRAESERVIRCVAIDAVGTRLLDRFVASWNSVENFHASHIDT